MALAVVLDSVPSSIVAGNSISWKWSDSRFPASAWTLIYSLVINSAQVKLTATADGDDFLITILSSDSSSWAPGDYSFQAHVSKSATSERYQVQVGVIKILQDFETEASGYDARSWVKKTLDAIRDVIDGKVLRDRASYAIAGRSLASYSWGEILDLEIEFKSRYSAELRKKKRQANNYKVRF